MNIALHMPSTSTAATGRRHSAMAGIMGDASTGGKNSAPAPASAVDAYATRVLERESPSSAVVDPSVGPYVTSLLRCADLREPDQLVGLGEYESLVELLEDQCSLSHDDAKKSLQTIAEAVCTGVVPHETSPSLSSSSSNVVMQFNLYGGAGALDSFHAVKEAVNDVSANTASAENKVMKKTSSSQGDGSLPTPTTASTSALSPYTPGSIITGPSPLKPDNLIPFDLLGALDNPSPQMSRTARMMEEHKIQHDQAFPPLGAPSPAPSQSKKPSRGGGSKKASRAIKDNTLATTLFAPSRPSQYVTPLSTSPENNAAQSSLSSSPDLSHESLAESQPDNHFYQQQINSAVEILLSMNTDVGEAAAREASIMASADFNVAQYIINAAISAPPVCRHMLHDGCYRSDCQFSHDVKGHTCLFWLRGRCGKGASCKFYHGFSKKIMDKLDTPVNTPNGNSNSNRNRSSGNHVNTAYVPMFSPQNSNGLGFSQSYSSFASATSSQDSSFGRSYDNASTTSWDAAGHSGSPSIPAPGSFANIASQGYDQTKFTSRPARSSSISEGTAIIPTVRIPQDLWNPHENRDASVFHLPDPLERYHRVASRVHRDDVIDLHFQSTKTFQFVLSVVLPEKVSKFGEVWIVTGTGHHVGSRTHQKGGGALEKAVGVWLHDQGFSYSRGRDRNGLGGALLVKNQ